MVTSIRENYSYAETDNNPSLDRASTTIEKTKNLSGDRTGNG
jgi:hypothetical protein